MDGKRIGIQIWRIFSPFVIKIFIALLVESAVTTIYMLNCGMDLGRIATQEEWANFAMQCMKALSAYVVEISMLSALVTIPVFWWMCRKDRNKRGETVAAQKISISHYGQIIGICIPMAIGLNIILLLVNFRFPDLAFQEASTTLSIPSFGVQFIGYGIVFPFFEEMLFRGLVYQRMKEYLTTKRAMISSALFFGLYHANLIQFMYAAISGMLFVYLFEKFGNIKVCILAHAVMNIAILLCSEFSVFSWIFASFARILFVAMVCAALTSVLFVNIRNTEQEK